MPSAVAVAPQVYLKKDRTRILRSSFIQATLEGLGVQLFLLGGETVRGAERKEEIASMSNTRTHHHHMASLCQMEDLSSLDIMNHVAAKIGGCGVCRT